MLIEFRHVKSKMELHYISGVISCFINEIPISYWNFYIVLFNSFKLVEFHYINFITLC